MTRGAGSRQDYYFRRVYVDAFRAVEAVQNHPEIDQEQASAADSSGTGAAKEIEV